MRGNADLTPYVPSLIFDWYRDHPDAMAREISGTMAFVDLSGFTAMSERLARLGKRGAEDVVDIISSTFSELLTVAYQMGGSLLKFGGDALLLFFAGDESAARGCAAVHGMRDALRKVGVIKTEAGMVRLGMSSGVHTGVFQMILAGESHKELVVLGSQTSECVAMEHAADRGEILVSNATAKAIGKSFVGRAKDGGRLLSSSPKPASLEVAPVATYGVEPSSFVPTAIRRHRISGEFEAEHRICSVAFVRFEGTDAAIGREGIHAIGARFKDFIARVQDVADSFELCFVTVDVDSDGGKLLLMAGAPVAHEDDEERMLRALREIRELNTLFPLRIGVNRGPVFVGDVGPVYRRSYTVMGDTVNTAARVMMHAEPGSLLATEPVLARSALRFEAKELVPFGAKGKSHLLTAFQVGEPQGMVTSTSAAGELVGREAELCELRELVSKTVAGAGSLVELRGDAGIGKSRLVEELLVTAEGHSWLHRCDRYAQRTPYSSAKAVFAEALRGEPRSERQLVEAVSGISPDLVPRTPMIAAVMGITTSEEDASGDQRIWTLQLQDAAYRLIAKSHLSGLFVFEDAHWMDEASRTLIEAVSSRLVERDLGFLLVQRLGAPELKDSRTMELSPLDGAASVRLARIAATQPLLPTDADIIAQRGKGNPSFIRALAESFDPQMGAEALPDTLEASIAARIDSLPPPQRLTLRHLSVLGMRFELRDVAAVIEPGESIESPLRGLEDMIEIDEGVARFRQSLFRDAAYGHLPFRVRSQLHERAGLHIEAGLDCPEDAAATLATHFHEARDFARSWRYSEAAGKSAFARYAFVDAIHHFRRALAAARSLDVPERALSTVYRNLGDSLRNTGRLSDASKAYAGGRKVAGPASAATARLALLEGDIRRRQGKPAAAIRWYRKGLRILDEVEVGPEERRDRVRMQLAIGNVRYDQGRFAEARAEFQSALEEAEATEDRAGIALASLWLQNVATALRDQAGQSCGERAVEIFADLGITHMEAQATASLAAHARASGEWSRAVELYSTCKATLERVGDSMNAAAIANNMGEILSDQGLLDRARALYEEAMATFTAAGHAWVYPVKGNIAWTLVKEGQFAAATSLLDEARAGMESIGAARMIEETDVRRANQLLLEGDADAALDAVAAIRSEPAGPFQPVLARIAGSAALVKGQRERAIERLEVAIQAANTTYDLFEEAQSCALLSLVLDPGPESNALRTRSAEMLDRLGVASVALLPPGTGVSTRTPAR